MNIYKFKFDIKCNLPKQYIEMCDYVVNCEINLLFVKNPTNKN